MELEEYRRLREYERSYWWHVGRRALLSAFLEWGVPADPARPGLDIGCGTGENFELLAPYGRFVGSEVEPTLWTDGKPKPSRPVLLAQGQSLPFADGSLGICTLFDVLEHVEAEDEFIREIRRVLRPGGWVCLSVPAYMFLWSDHDVSLHHRRRYVRAGLRDAFVRNGFEVVRITYVMASMFPLVAGYRLLSKVQPGRGEPRTSYVTTPEPFNSCFARILAWEGKWLAKGDFPFGTSLFALARKPGGAPSPG